MLTNVKTQAIQICFFSYRIRDLVFCESPAIIALAAFDKALQTTSAVGTSASRFSSARELLENTLSEADITRYGKTPEERDSLWLKVVNVKTLLDTAIRDRD